MSVIRNNSSDLRVQKTVKAVKQALVTLIMQKPYRQIRVDELDKEAMINRQTFYSHFASIDNVLEAIGEDMLGELQEGLKALVPADLLGGVALFYRYMNTDDPVKEKLFFDSEFETFSAGFAAHYFSLDFFSGLCMNEDYVDIVPSFMANAASGIFRRWRNRPADDRVSLEELADNTAKLLMTGLNGLNS